LQTVQAEAEHEPAEARALISRRGELKADSVPPRRGRQMQPARIWRQQIKLQAALLIGAAR
jgi:hypothetical protein